MFSVEIKGVEYDLSILNSRGDWTNILYFKTSELYDVYFDNPNSPYIKDYILLEHVQYRHIKDTIIYYYDKGYNCSSMISTIYNKNTAFNKQIVSIYISELISAGSIGTHYISNCVGYVPNLSLKYINQYITVSQLYLNDMNNMSDLITNILSIENDGVWIINPICKKHNLTFDISFEGREFSYMQNIFDNTSLDKYIPYARLNTGYIKIAHTYLLSNIPKFIESIRKHSDWNYGSIMFLFQNHSEDVMNKTFYPGVFSLDKSQIKVIAKDFVNVYPIFENISRVFNIPSSALEGIIRSDINLKFDIDIGPNTFFNSAVANFVIFKYMSVFNLFVNIQKPKFLTESNQIELTYGDIDIIIVGEIRQGTYYDAYKITRNIQYVGILPFEKGTILTISIKRIPKSVQIPKLIILITLFAKLYKWYITSDPDGFVQLLYPNLFEASKSSVNNQLLSLSGMGRDKLYLAGKMGIYSRITNKPGFGSKDQYDDLPSTSKIMYEFNFMGRCYPEYIFCLTPYIRLYYPNHIVTDDKPYLVLKNTRISFFFEDIMFPKCFAKIQTVKNIARNISTKNTILHNMMRGNVSKSISEIYAEILSNLNIMKQIKIYLLGNATGVRNFIYCIASTRVVNNNYNKFLKDDDIYNDIDREVESIVSILQNNRHDLNPLKYLSDKEFSNIVLSNELYMDPIRFKGYVEINLEINIIFLEHIGTKIRRVYGEKVFDVPEYDEKMIIILKRDTSETKYDKMIYRCESIIMDEYIGYTELYYKIDEVTDNTSIEHEVNIDVEDKGIIYKSPDIITTKEDFEHMDTLHIIRSKFVTIINWGFAKMIKSSGDFYNSAPTMRTELINYYISNFFEIRSDNLSDVEFYNGLLSLDFLRKADSFLSVTQRYFGSDKFPVTQDIYNQKLYAILFMSTKDFNLQKWANRKTNYDIFVKKFYFMLSDFSVDYNMDNISMNNSIQLSDILRFIVSSKIITDMDIMRSYKYPFYTTDNQNNVYIVENKFMPRTVYRTKNDINRVLVSYAGKTKLWNVNPDQEYGFKLPKTYNPVNGQLYMVYRGGKGNFYAIISPI